METYYQKNKKRIIARVTQWRKDNPEKVTIYRRKYDNSEKGKDNKKAYRIENVRMCRKARIDWEERNPELKKKIQKEWRLNDYKKDSQKYIARNIASAKTKLKSNCEICSSTRKLARHHWNYEKPLLVNTLCRDCHDIQHIKHFALSKFAGGI